MNICTLISSFLVQNYNSFHVGWTMAPGVRPTLTTSKQTSPNKTTYSMRPAPSIHAATATARLPARPVTDGASPGAKDFALAVEVVAVVVPFVWVSLEVTREARLASEPNVAETLLAFLHTEVE